MKIIEVHRPELEPALVAESLGEHARQEDELPPRAEEGRRDLHGRRRKGIKIMVAGRLQGAEMARVGYDRNGAASRAPRLRAQLDYGTFVAKTKYGTIGVKVWIFKGELGPRETTNGPAASAFPSAEAAGTPL